MLFVFVALVNKETGLVMLVFVDFGMVILLEGSCCLVYLDVATVGVVFLLVHRGFGV